MVSYELTVLFTSIPTDEALSVARKCLMNDPTLGERTALTAEQVSTLQALCLDISFRSEESIINNTMAA